jgi:hypothetical protein
MNNENKYYVKISPEVILNKIFTVPYDGPSETITQEVDPCCDTTTTTSTFIPTEFVSVYSSMTQLVTGGTNGTSTFVDMSIPILLVESAVDYGFYSVFDGAISQKDVVTNFVFSATSADPYTVYVYNTSDNKSNFIKQTSFKIEWGDGFSENLNNFAPNYISHTFQNILEQTEYNIKLTQTTPWGINEIFKKIKLPFTDVTIENPNGTVFFTSFNLNWADTPISYDYLFTGDSNNFVEDQISSSYIDAPLIVSSYTQSRINELQSYGVQKFKQSVIFKGGEPYGQITDITENYTGYTIQQDRYIDFKDGTTIQFVESYGLTKDWLVAEPITKEEVLINVAFQTEIQSNVFIERGKNSALERIERLNEVDNMGDLEKYGYKFFKLR